MARFNGDFLDDLRRGPPLCVRTMDDLNAYFRSRQTRPVRLSTSLYFDQLYYKGFGARRGRLQSNAWWMWL